MRRAYNEVGVIELKRDSGDIALGISLGFDHCAEHEWGSRGIRQRLGVSDVYNVMDFVKNYEVVSEKAPSSVEDFKIKSPASLILITAEGPASAVPVKSTFEKGEVKKVEVQYKEAFRQLTGKKKVPTPMATVGILMCLDPWVLSHMAEKLSESLPAVAVALKEGSNRLHLSLAEIGKICEFFRDADLHKAKLSAYIAAAAEKNITVTLSKWQNIKPVSIWGSDEFFFMSTTKSEVAVLTELWEKAQKGLAYYGLTTTDNPFSRSSICILAEDMSASEKDAVAKKWADVRDLAKKIIATGVVENLEKAGKRYYALSPRVGENGELSFWLNPADQDKFNYGWYSVEDLYAWAKDSGPIVKMK